MSLDVYLEVVKPTEIYNANITHNLNAMADAAGIYYALWRPEEVGITTAAQLIPLLEVGLDNLKADPEYYHRFDDPNGWGTYDQFVPWVEKYLGACRKEPDAVVRVSR